MPEPSDQPRRTLWGRWLLLGVIVLIVVAFFASEGRERLTWESFKERREQLQQTLDEHPVLFPAAFFGLYVVATGLSLPGAWILSVAAGALFGRWLGLGLVSFASTAGATLAFLSVRYLLRDFVERRFGERAAAINRGIEKDGIFYLFTLRLIPLFPFFLINLALGLTRMRVRTFWWVSQLGMLPGTFLYVNAGAELGRIDSPRDILTPTVLVSLALLGVVPLLLRWVLRRWKRGSAGQGSKGTP